MINLKKHFLKITITCLSLFILSGCAYSNVKYPLDTDVENTNLGSKVGKSSFHSMMWLVAWGDAGTQAAATNGEIMTVRHLDAERFVLLFGLYSRVTTIAYGD